MTALRVCITRYVGDEPQPGIVECELVDASARRWIFIEKTSVVSSANLNAQASYPRHGWIVCEILSSRQDNGRTILLVDTETSGVASIEGVTRFEVFATMVEADAQ